MHERKKQRELTPRAAAKDLIRQSVHQGDSLDSVRAAKLEMYSTLYSAGIGRSIVAYEGNRVVVTRAVSEDEIGVSSVAMRRCEQVFPLPEIYAEVRQEFEETLLWQPPPAGRRNRQTDTGGLIQGTLF